MTTDPLQDLRELRRAALEASSGSPAVDMLSAAGIDASWSQIASDEAGPARLVVAIDGTGGLDASAAADVTNGLQEATAMIVRGFRKPGENAVQLRRGDTGRARLVQAAQYGRTLVFEVPRSTLGDNQLPVADQATMVERAVGELVEVLPEGPEDDVSLDAILGQSASVRVAVEKLVKATRATPGIELELRTPGRSPVASVLSQAQAGVLGDSLGRVREEVERRQHIGRLDGLRTKRRLFYLEDDAGREWSGAIDEDLVGAVQAALNTRVIATVEVTTSRSVSGRRGREHLRLIRLDVMPELTP